MADFDKMYVKVMADYMTNGLWHNDGTPFDKSEVDELPLDMFIKNRLAKWCDWYEDNDDWSIDSKGDFDYERFAAEGLGIAKKIQEQLGPLGYKIWYFDEYACSRECDISEINFEVK